MKFYMSYVCSFNKGEWRLKYIEIMLGILKTFHGNLIARYNEPTG